MNRREFILAAAASATITGCRGFDIGGKPNRMLLGACRGPNDVKLMKSLGYDFWEWSVWQALDPNRDDEWWKRQKDLILSQPLPLRSCNGFIPGNFRLTGPKADHAPALVYAEKVLRRAEEVGVDYIVFGSGGARNVPGDYTIKDAKPDVEKGARQYADFCREVAKLTSDLKHVAVVIEPLRPNESNIINYVWQGVEICREINSPRIAQLADIYHMMMGGDSADALRNAVPFLKHVHVAAYDTRFVPGDNPQTVAKLRPYFEALKDIGYVGGVSCECRWGNCGDIAKELELNLKTMKELI